MGWDDPLEFSLIHHFIASFASWTSRGVTEHGARVRARELGIKKSSFCDPRPAEKTSVDLGMNRIPAGSHLQGMCSWCRVTADVTAHPGRAWILILKLIPALSRSDSQISLEKKVWNPHSSFGGLGVDLGSTNIWIRNQVTFLAVFLLKKKQDFGEEGSTPQQPKRGFTRQMGMLKIKNEKWWKFLFPSSPPPVSSPDEQVLHPH